MYDYDYNSLKMPKKVGVPYFSVTRYQMRLNVAAIKLTQAESLKNFAILRTQNGKLLLVFGPEYPLVWCLQPKTAHCDSKIITVKLGLAGRYRLVPSSYLNAYFLEL